MFYHAQISHLYRHVKRESPIRYRTIKGEINPDVKFFDEEDYDSILSTLPAWRLITFESKIVAGGDGRQVNTRVVKLTDFGQRQFGLLVPALT